MFDCQLALAALPTKADFAFGIARRSRRSSPAAQTSPAPSAGKAASPYVGDGPMIGQHVVDIRRPLGTDRWGGGVYEAVYRDAVIYRGRYPVAAAAKVLIGFRARAAR